MAPISGLTVRQHKRESIDLPVQFIVDETHRAQVRFTVSSTAVNQNTIQGIATDLSKGGLGMESLLFLPRLCEGVIRIFHRTDDDLNPKTIQESMPVIEARVKVQRVVLSSHEPTYAIGMSFLDPPPDLHERISKLCVNAADSESAWSDGGEGAGNA